MTAYNNLHALLFQASAEYVAPNGTYGGWLHAYEGNALGAGDELAATGEPVRQGLEEPQAEFTYVKPGAEPEQIETVTPKGPKLFPSDFLRIWTGRASPLA